MTKEYKDGKYKELSELNPKDEGDKILVEGMVIGQGEVEHYPTSLITKCPTRECTEDWWEQKTREDDWRDPILKRKCSRCNLVMHETVNSKDMIKRIIVSEQGKDNPLFLNCFIYGEDINRIQPGKIIRMEGILRSRKAKKTDMTLKKLFDVTRFRLTEDKPILPTEEDIEMFKALDKTELIKSFAPHIRNMYLLKEGLLLACLGGVEKDKFRGDINMLMLGDPGLAKTQLLNFAVMINQKSDYASGNSASGAGLFGGIDKTPDGTHYAKAGAAVMCNGGILALDEMEKMNPDDRVYAHEVMESQTFTLRKIVRVKWEVKISILAAANPKKSRWNPELTINENVNLPESLMSRFGLIALVRDIPVKPEDQAIAEHIEKVMAGEVESTLTVEQMMKFLNYAKKLEPKSTDEARKKITEWWTTLRQVDQAEGSIAVDIRTLQDIHRISQAYAKLDLSDTVTVDHANRAIKLFNDYLHTMGMNTPGERNTSITETFDKMGYFKYVFMKPQTMLQAQTKMLEKPKWWSDESKAHDFIVTMHGKGILTESGGEYSLV